MGWVALSQESVMLSQVTEVSLDGGNPDRVCLMNLLEAPHPLATLTSMWGALQAHFSPVSGLGSGPAEAP